MIDKRYKKKMLKNAVEINREIYQFRGGYAWIKQRLVDLFTYIYYFVKIYIFNKCVLPYFEIVLTTRCSLRCKDCASIIPYYCNPYDIDWNMIEDSLTSLFNNVDEVRMMGVIGGETFLAENLSKTLNYLIREKKVKSIRVFSNAVVHVPLKEKLIHLLKNKKVHVSISNYGIPQSNDFYEYLLNESIEARMGGVMKWFDRGDMTSRGRTNGELTDQFQKCYMKTCKSILNGKFYYCPRSGHGHDLGIIETPENDYVDLLNNKNVRDRILRLYYDKEYLAACNFCDVGTGLCTEIPAAVQLTKEEQQEIWKNERGKFI